MNPMQMMQQIMGSMNPMQMMNQMFGNNPLFQRAMQMAQGKSPQELQEVARNLCQQKGLQFDNALSQMQKMGVDVMGGKVQNPNPPQEQGK